MAERGDISVNQDTGVVEVASPSVTLAVQDLHDTLRAYEDELTSTIFDDMISSGGKEELGGGLFVGVTSTLQDSRRVAFESRKVWISTGTITTGDADGIVLTDISATFVTDGVEDGAWIVNLTDGSITSVVVVLGETQLQTNGLGAGSDDQFDMSDDYRVMNVIQCEVTDGNLVAIERDGTAISPILPTAGTQVILSRAVSATLQELEDIQHGSFNGGVMMNIAGGTAGTTFPTGTSRQPSNNFADALTILATEGLNKLFVTEAVTAVTTGNFTGIRFEGRSPSATALTVGAGATMTSCEFAFVTLSGTFDGAVLIEHCTLGALTTVDGTIETSGWTDTVTMGGGGPLNVIDCYDAVIGSGAPTLDGGGVGEAILLHGWRGDLTIQNKSGSDAAQLGLRGGNITLAADITDGAFSAKGDGYVINNMGGTATLDDGELASSIGSG